MFQPVAIIKADEFVATSHKGWEKFLYFISSKQLRVGLGLITSTLLYADNDDVRWLKSLNKFQFEFYFNGWDYFIQDDLAEFQGRSLTEQVSRIQWGLQVMKNKLNYTPHTFAAPGNRYDSLTTLAVRQFQEFKIWLLGEPASGLFILKTAVPVESTPGVVLPLQDFITAYYLHRQEPAIVLEVHPRDWSTEQYDKFEAIFHYLVSQNRRFPTPFGYFAWLKDRDAIQVSWSSQNAVIIDCTNCIYAHDLVFAYPPEEFIALEFGIPD